MIETDLEKNISEMEKGKALVIHHYDQDGRSAAAMVGLVEKNCDFMEVNHSKDITISNTDDMYKKLIIVDYSIPPKQLIEMCSIFDEVIWIDHHKTAIKEFDNYVLNLANDTLVPRNLKNWSYYDKENPKAACELTYARYLHNTDWDIPSNRKMVKLLGDWDVWRYVTPTPEVLALHYGTNDYTVDNFKFAFGISYKAYCVVEDIVSKYMSIVKYEADKRAETLKKAGFKTDFFGYSAYVVNGNDKSSLAFGDEINNVDVCIMYNYTGKDEYQYSIYSVKHDVSLIAEKFGGGGHEGAAGFRLPYDYFFKKKCEGEKQNVADIS